jgi:chitodextrinase
MNILFKILVAFVAFFTPDTETVKSGNFNDTATWSNGVPNKNRNIRINQNHVVTMTANDSCKNIEMYGFSALNQQTYRLYIKGGN